MAEDEARVTKGGWRWPLGPIRVLIIATAVLSVVFLLLPKLDLWFSRQFYDAEIGFPALRIPALQWLRDVSGILLWVIGAVVVLSLLAKLLVFPRRRPVVPGRAMLFLSATLALSAGLLVNVILKSLWGRPRPTQVIDFGGDAPFITAWHISDYCARNCSFVSGEASSSIWMVAVALVVPARYRTAALGTALALAFAFSLNRIAFGGHFLSDVLLAWTLTLLIIAAAYHFLYVKPPRFFEESAIDGALTRAGLWLRGLVARRGRTEPPLHPEAVAVLTGAGAVAATRSEDDEHGSIAGYRSAGHAFAEAVVADDTADPATAPAGEATASRWDEDGHRDLDTPEEAARPAAGELPTRFPGDPASARRAALPTADGSDDDTEAELMRVALADLPVDTAPAADTGNIESIDPEPEEAPPVARPSDAAEPPAEAVAAPAADPVAAEAAEPAPVVAVEPHREVAVFVPPPPAADAVPPHAGSEATAADDDAPAIPLPPPDRI